MIEDDKNELNKVEGIKKKLFSKSYQTQIKEREGYTIFKKNKLPESWEHGDEFNVKTNLFNKTPIFKNFFIFSVVFFFIALGYLYYNFFIKGNNVSNDNIEIAVLGNTFTSGGEILPLIVEITNNNNSDLELVDLVVEYPKGSTLGGDGDIERTRQSLGTILKGSVRNEKIEVVLFGEQNSIHELKISIEYRIEGSTSVFVKDKLYKITISETPINFVVEAPPEAIPNQDLTFKIKTKLNDTKSFSNMLVKLDYPLGFEFVSSVPSPSIGNNIWNLGDLPKGGEREITINGKMIDVYDGEEKIFYIYSGPQKNNDKSEIGVIFNSLAHSILIKKPFLEAKLFVGGDYKKEYAVDTKSPIIGTIHWVNNLNVPINDMEIRAKFKGNVFNPKNVLNDEGFYDSLENVIIWDKNTEKNFSEVKPLESGIVKFSLSPTSVFSSSSGSLVIDPSIIIEVSIFGKQNISGTLLGKLNNIESKVVKIISDVSLSNKLSHSISEPIIDTGPFPPQVEKETTYTVTWTLINTTNNVSKVKVRSSLPTRVNYKDIVFPKDEDISYNPGSREILWNVGGLQKGAGINSKGREVSFQISITPSLSEIKETPLILERTTLSGFDDFTNTEIKLIKESLKTTERVVE